MKIVIKSKLQLLVVVLLAMSAYGWAQLSQDSNMSSTAPTNPPCDTLIAERLDRVRKRGSRTPKRLYPPVNQKLISPALNDMTKNGGLGELLAYRFKGPRKTALLMHTTRVGSPLSEDSIQDWFIQVGQNVARFKSIATNPNLLFWDEEGRLNYFTILYSEGAVMNASSNLVSLDFRRFRLMDSGAMQLVEEDKNVRCALTMAKPR